MDFKGTDNTAPRFRSKSTNFHNEKTLKEFKKKFPKYKSLTIKEFRNIISEFNGMMMDSVIDNRDGLVLPENLGYVLITRTLNEKRSSNVDYKTSKELGKVVGHSNWDSDNFLAKICYTNYRMKYTFKNRKVWAFAPSKQFKNLVSSTFAENYNKYTQLGEGINISDLYK